MTFVLSLNVGSSSIKYAVHEMPDGLQIWAGSASVAPEAEVISRAVTALSSELESRNILPEVVGNRIVFGGPDDEPKQITPQLLERLRGFTGLDPLHAPAALAAAQAAFAAFPKAEHVACFDTYFFRDLPPVATVLPVPSADPLLRRYGFHGLSYEYVLRKIGDALPRRTILLHLGSGCSAAAVLDGRPVDTTMGFSPLGGMIMASRPGDLDPGVLLYMLEQEEVALPEVRDMLEKRSGLRALSGGEGDVSVLARAGDDSAAAFAVHAFVRSACKAVAGLTASLGGLDLLVFTGGIGEHVDEVRSAITASLTYLGMEVRVIPTDENATIAHHAYAVLQNA